MNTRDQLALLRPHFIQQVQNSGMQQNPLAGLLFGLWMNRSCQPVIELLDVLQAEEGDDAPNDWLCSALEDSGMFVRHPDGSVTPTKG